MSNASAILGYLHSLSIRLNPQLHELRESCVHPHRHTLTLNYSRERALHYCPDCHATYFGPIPFDQREEMVRRVDHSATI